MVEEVIRWRRGERPEEQTSTGASQGIAGTVVADTIARHGESDSISTSDRAEWAAFLGFDPWFPMEIGDGWDSRFFSSVIMPDKIMMSCQYYGGEPDGQRAALRMNIFTEIGQTRMAFEQDSEGEWQVFDGLPVYRLVNSGHTVYLWMRDNELYMLTLNSTESEMENVFREVMAWWRGEQPEQ